MKTFYQTWLCRCLLPLLLALAWFSGDPLLASPYTLKWSVTPNGGGVSTNTTYPTIYTIKATIGQSVAAQILAGSGYVLKAGAAAMYPAPHLNLVPVITTQPQPVTVPALGQPVSVSVGVAGSAFNSYQYQWLKDGVRLVNQTNATLTFAAFQFTDCGNYQVVVSSPFGLAISVPVAVTLPGAPLIGMGDNGYGELGLGNNVGSTNVPVSIASNVVAAAAGLVHSLFMKSDGTLWGMGDNTHGQLGLGNNVSTNIPVIIASNVVAAAAGSAHSLFMKSDGTLWGMGWNINGGLGNGTTNNSNEPIYVTNNVVAVAAGEEQSYYVKNDGTLWGVGYNFYGQLGQGNSTTRTNIPVFIANNVVGVAAGYTHTLYVKNDGTLWGMGYNESGELGQGNNVFSANVPVVIASNVVAAAAGDNCSLFVKSDGTLWGMGDNTYGELGLGTNVSTNIPVIIASNVVVAAAGLAHSLFMKSDGTLWGMGDNEYGQLGNGTYNSTNVPVAVPGLTVASLAAMPTAHHSLAVAAAVPLLGPLADQTVMAGGTATFTAVVSNAAVLGPVTYAWRDPNGITIHGATTSVLTINPATQASAGTYTVIVTAWAGAAAASASLTVNPAIILNCSTNIIVTSSSPSDVGTRVHYTVSATGGCIGSLAGGPPLGPTVVADPPSDSPFPYGTTTVNVTAYDTCGDTQKCSFTVTVNHAANAAIALNCSSNLTVTATNTNGAVVQYSVSASGGCDPTNVPTVVATPPSGSSFPIGTNTVVVTAFDTCGDTNLCSFTVTVLNTTPPVITWSFTNLTLSTGSNCSALMPDVTGTNYILATDPSSNVLTLTQTPTNNAILTVGTNVVIVAVGDGNGNTDYSTNTIVVRDTTPPVVTLVGANPIIVECHSSFTDPGVTATDNCTITNLTANGVVNVNSPGTYTIIYLAVDAAGNSAVKSRTVYVVDTTAPIITQCAANQVIVAGTNGTAALPDLTPLIVASDACSGILHIRQAPPVGTLLPLGTHEVDFVVEDESSNSVQCSCTVTVTAAANAVAGAPTLQLRSITVSNLVLSWPSVYADYELQQNDDLANPAGWLPSAMNIIDDGTNHSVSLVPYSGKLYFRLKNILAGIIGNGTPAGNDTPAGMTLIPEGSFTMGDTLDGMPNALPTNIFVSKFCMDTNLITLGLWQTVYNWATNHGYSFENVGSGHIPNYPVFYLKWWDCVKWCNARSEMEGRVPAYYTSPAQTTVYRTGRVDVDSASVNWSQGYRLPTEAEWEKAARGGLSQQRFPWGNTISEYQANYWANPGAYDFDLGPYTGFNTNFDTGSMPYINPVGFFPPNGYGLFDMAGNLFEWCWDWYGTPLGQPTTNNPTGPASSGAYSLRVLRGGCWLLDMIYCRTAARFNSDPTDNGSNGRFGFRCVLPPTPTVGMTVIPASDFRMGDNLDGDVDAPLTNIYVSQFAIDTNLVTYGYWQYVYRWATSHGYSFDNAGSGKAADHPVQAISWYDTVKWCNARSELERRLPAYYTSPALVAVYRTGKIDLTTDCVIWRGGYRLPTEAEWEKAGRGRLSGLRFPWGNTIGEDRANYHADVGGMVSYDLGPNSGYNVNFDTGGYPYTSPVGSFFANGYGLNDMAGNLLEWCWDWYGIPYGQPTLNNPTGAPSGVGRVVRGGSWSDNAFSCRTAHRNNVNPVGDNYYVGFRCVVAPSQ